MRNKTVIRIIIALAAVVVISMMVTLIEGNYLMLSKITTESLMSVTLIKSLGFSIAALIIIVYDKRIWVKLLFVVLDSAIVFCLQKFDAGTWTEVGGYIYGPYLGLNLFFIGMIISEELSKVLNGNTVQSINENMKIELAETRKNLAKEVDNMKLAEVKIFSLLDQKLVNAKRGRGQGKSEYVTKVEQEIKSTKKTFNIK